MSKVGLAEGDEETTSTWYEWFTTVGSVLKYIANKTRVIARSHEPFLRVNYVTLLRFSFFC